MEIPRHTVSLLFCFVLGVAAPDPLAAPRTITLEEALRLAEASPALPAITLEVDRATAEVGASGLWPNPVVSVSREEAAGTVDRFANLSVPLPLTRRTALEKDAARSGLDAAKARSELAHAGLRLRVREMFAGLVEQQRRHETLTTGLSDLTALVEILRAREAEGESSGFDRMRAERERADLEADLFHARAGLAKARISLASLVGIAAEDLTVDGTLERPAAFPGRDEMTKLLASRGDIVALDADAQRADTQARAARRRGVPEPVFTLGAKTTETDGESGTGAVAGIAFDVPLFDRGQGSLAVARADGALLRARREALTREAEGEALAAFAEAEARRAAEDAYAATGDAEDLIRIAKAAYEAGEMRILDLLDAYRTALATRLKTIELKADARRAEAALNRVLGTEVVR
ncbi:MAG TPA: TolC family protein [Candidatus Polarisedimenticolia bacterium]|nr:TolC family protein [Candidatus Polarisedimenticolia bacterium]